MGRSFAGTTVPVVFVTSERGIPFSSFVAFVGGFVGGLRKESDVDKESHSLVRVVFYDAIFPLFFFSFPGCGTKKKKKEGAQIVCFATFCDATAARARDGSHCSSSLSSARTRRR